MGINVRLNDRLLVVILFVAVAVLAVIASLSFRENTKQTGKTVEGIQTSRDYSEISIVCLLETSGKVNFKEIPYTADAIEKEVAACFERQAGKRQVN